jgi:AcrR family transcriptional regulator
MANKSVDKPQKSVKERAVKSALSLAASLGWEFVTMSDIAEETGVGLSDLVEIFDDKADIVTAYGKYVDRKVLENVGVASPDETARDRLFEIIMERFDVLSEHRDAVISILSSFRTDPKEAIISLPHLARSMTWMMEAAGLDTSGFKGAARVTGLTLLYANVLRIWMKDDSEDQAKTMAALDKNLDRAEQVANTFMLS